MLTHIYGLLNWHEFFMNLNQAKKRSIIMVESESSCLKDSSYGLSVRIGSSTEEFLNAGFSGDGTSHSIRLILHETNNYLRLMISDNVKFTSLKVILTTKSKSLSAYSMKVIWN
ncbi:hypothetical protein RIR_jg31962.t1 [Rhizophagus irregularis DAOM 181602=DAOM 197198]|nr:hypothetical protein RIR_jg31962.t1 [Rhizophagus irregularis DAOM 181602=DAOM 197198]